MKETEIREAIIDYIKKRGGFVWKDRQIPGRPGRGTVKSSNGVPDLLGIWRGKPLAIEVKTKNGVISEAQMRFINDFVFHGGIGFVARSVDDVIERLGGGHAA